MNHRDRASPVALTRHAPIAQAVLHDAFAQTLFFNFCDSGALGVIQGSTGVFPGFDKRLELSGDSGFRSDTAIVHATQYFGKRKKPRGAAVFRALFRDESP